jgi:hypothetical protein
VPTKARALARPLQVELVCPQCHALAAHDPAHGHHDALVVDQAVEDRVQVVEGLDHADRVAGLIRTTLPRFGLTRRVLALNGRAAGLDVAVAIDRVVVFARAQTVRFGALCHPLGGLGQLLQLDVGEDGVASEEAISPVRLALLGA